MLNFFSTKVEVPKPLVFKAGLPPVLKGKGTSKISKFFKELDKNKNLSIYQILDQYYDLVSKNSDIKSNLGKDYLKRIQDYQNAKNFFLSAEKLMAENKLNEAIHDYERGLEIFPYLYNARLNLGYLYRETKNYAASEKIYLEGLKLIPGDLLLHTNLGRTYFEMQNPELAIASFKKALEIDPKDQFSLQMLEQLGEFIRIYKDEKDPMSSELLPVDTWSQTIEHNIQNAPTIAEMIKHLFSVVKVQKNEMFLKLWKEHSEKIIADEGKSEMWYILEGFSKRMQKNDKEAQDIWKEALSLYPTSVTLHTNLGKVQQGKERIQTYLKAFELGDRTPDSKVLFFETLKDLDGDHVAKDKMIELYRKYYDFGFVEIVAVNIYDENSTEFIDFLVKHLNEAPNDIKIINIGNIAALLGNKGNLKGVIRLTESYVKNEIKDFTIHWNYMMAHKALGDMKTFLQHLKYLSSQDWLSDQEKEILAKQK